MTTPHAPDRREFLGHGALAVAPLIVPASVLGRDERREAPAARLNIGCIGTGGRGRSLLNSFMNERDVQVVAVCDVDRQHRDQGQQLVHKKYGNKDCVAFGDFRDLLAHRGLDAVIVATPDHWHALPTIAAARAGKDIYCEKPLANSIGEGRAICRAVADTRRILQCGSHERSGSNARFACELVRNGKIGKLHTIRINLPCSDPHHQRVRKVDRVPPAEAVPAHLDYNFWLGHTPNVPYTPGRVHFSWRFILAYGGGEMTDRGAHVIDLGQLGANTDDTGPTEIEATGVKTRGSMYDVFWDYTFTNTFASGLKIIGSTTGPRGVKFEGSEGWVFIHVHGARLEASREALLKEDPARFTTRLGRTTSHIRNFLDCVKSRTQPFATAEIGHRTATICHLNNIAMLLGRKLRWDPAREQFVGDEAANRLVTPTMRAPWKL